MAQLKGLLSRNLFFVVVMRPLFLGNPFPALLVRRVRYSGRRESAVVSDRLASAYLQRKCNAREHVVSVWLHRVARGVELGGGGGGSGKPDKNGVTFLPSERGTK